MQESRQDVTNDDSGQSSSGKTPHKIDRGGEGALNEKEKEKDGAADAKSSFGQQTKSQQSGLVRRIKTQMGERTGASNSPPTANSLEATLTAQKGQKGEGAKGAEATFEPLENEEV